MENRRIAGVNQCYPAILYCRKRYPCQQCRNWIEPGSLYIALEAQRRHTYHVECYPKGEEEREPDSIHEL